VYAVVPAGGSGTRLWPLSRAGKPKFLLDLAGTGRTLIQATYDRLAPLAGPDRLYVVTGGAHAAAIARQLPELPAEHLLVEPAPRDSAPAIGLAAALIAKRDPDAIMGSFAADHVVRNDALFRSTVDQAARAAAAGYLVTIGITADRPDTGYGYLRRGAVLAEGPGFLVEEFKEKPALDVAQAYLDTGRYLWNASIFLWRAQLFLDELQAQQPVLYDGLQQIAAAWGTPAQDGTLGAIWPGLPRVTVDEGVMEDAAARGRVATVPGDFGWHDVGDWDTLAGVLPASADGNVVVGARGDYLGVDTTDCVVVPRPGRLLATLGLHGLVLVDTDDAVLVCPRSRAQDVRLLVEALRVQGRDALR